MAGRQLPGGISGGGCGPVLLSVQLEDQPIPTTLRLGEDLMAGTSSSQPEEIQEPDPLAVIARLHELGIPQEVLLEALRIGYQKGDFTTAAHPRTYQGTVVWGEITAELRGRLKALGWDLDDTDNIARVISPDEEVVVVAVRGNHRTGRRSKHEQLSTLRPRGPAGVRIIKVNIQFELILQEDGDEMSQDVLSDFGGTWFLLYNRVEDIIRSELSFANAVDESGSLLKWRERLVLPDIDLLRPPPEDDQGEGTPDVDVPVTRRVS